MSYRPHVLGIDDGPFDKALDDSVPLVGVMTEGADLVEAVAVSEFPLDGDGATEFLAEWVLGLRCASALHAVVLGGITIAGLGIIDIEALARRLALPVMIVNRRLPENEPVIQALQAAGLAERIPVVDRSPAAWRVSDGLFVASVGASRDETRRILEAARNKSRLPEPLRLAHLIASAIVRGQSRGRP